MKYADFEKLQNSTYWLQEYGRLKCEQGDSEQVGAIMDELAAAIQAATDRIRALPGEAALEEKEPDTLEEIRKLRPTGPRRMTEHQPGSIQEKMKGALYARIIGCLLGVPVEGWTMERIEGFSALTGQDFPPVDYYPYVEYGDLVNVYGRPRSDYFREKMTFVPVDDDIIYTQIALLVLERYGTDFKTADMGAFWREHLPFACTAEEAALKNLAAGLSIDEVGTHENPFIEWIGAAIRSDGFGYAAAGYPEKAAAMAHADAYLSHRRNGIYGEMFLAAAQAAAFMCETPGEALRIGLSEIPAECRLAEDLRWALGAAENTKEFRQAVRLVRERFAGMSAVHTNNNLCLVVFGLILGEGDILQTLSLTVAMGMDNDCTAASAGSIVGAIAGFSQIPEYLYARFQDRCDTYLTGFGHFSINDMAERFTAINQKLLAEG